MKAGSSFEMRYTMHQHSLSSAVLLYGLQRVPVDPQPVQTGCFGNVSSAAYAVIDTATGGFSTYNNINIKPVDNSVFIKAFLVNGAIPSDPGGEFIDFTPPTSGIADCALFFQSGLPLGTNGILMRNQEGRQGLRTKSMSSLRKNALSLIVVLANK